MSAKTERQVEDEVKALLKSLGASDNKLFMSVKECRSGGTYWSSGVPNGMFQIDLWGMRTQSQYKNRDHFFRTKKDGSIPVEKITEYVEQQLGRAALLAEANRKKENAKAATAGIHETVVAFAKDAMPGVYWSTDYRSQHGHFITNDTSVEGKVAIDVGTLVVDEAQAKALLALVGSFKKA